MVRAASGSSQVDRVASGNSFMVRAASGSSPLQDLGLSQADRVAPGSQMDKVPSGSSRVPLQGLECRPALCRVGSRAVKQLELRVGRPSRHKEDRSRTDGRGHRDRAGHQHKVAGSRLIQVLQAGKVQARFWRAGCPSEGKALLSHGWIAGSFFRLMGP